MGSKLITLYRNACVFPGKIFQRPANYYLQINVAWDPDLSLCYKIIKACLHNQ